MSFEDAANGRHDPTDPTDPTDQSKKSLIRL